MSFDYLLYFFIIAIASVTTPRQYNRLTKDRDKFKA